MAVQTYECLFLLEPNKASADWEGVSGSANSIIEHHGGELIDTRPWGEHKLAYPIKHFRKGSYLLTYFRCESTRIPAIEADFRLNETILRHMVQKLLPQIADEIILHLKGEEQPQEQQEEVAVGSEESQ